MAHQASTALQLKHESAGCQIQIGGHATDQSQLEGPPLQLMNSVKHNPPPLEIDNHSYAHDIPRVLWNLMVHYCVPKRLPADTI